MPKRLPPEVHADRESWQTEKGEREQARKRRNREKLGPLLENPRGEVAHRTACAAVASLAGRTRVGQP